MLALECGIPPRSIVFSGVAKNDEELVLAIGAGIRAIQAESIEEIARIEAHAAAAKRTVPISIRLNPGLDLDTLATHVHVATGHDEAKFGVAAADLPVALEGARACEHVELVGVSSHVGSQLSRSLPT